MPSPVSGSISPSPPVNVTAFGVCPAFDAGKDVAGTGSTRYSDWGPPDTDPGRYEASPVKSLKVHGPKMPIWA